MNLVCQLTILKVVQIKILISSKFKIVKIIVIMKIIAKIIRILALLELSINIIIRFIYFINIIFINLI